jgi:GNAT superfamily N-acetyltransferase
MKPMIFKDHPEVKALSFEVSSARSNFTISSLGESIAAVFEDLSPDEKYCTNFKVRVFALNSAGEKVTEVAFLTGTSLDAESAYAEEADGILMLCDMVSTDLCQMAEAITDEAGNVKRTICPPERCIMYIHNMYVEEAYRSAGLGRYLLDNVNELFAQAFNYAHHVCVLRPYPQVKSGDCALESKDDAAPEDVERLIAFYKRAGYKLIGDSGYMYMIQKNAFEESLDI